MDKINGSIRSFVKPQCVARAGSDIAATNEPFAKNVSRHAAEIQVANWYFSARFVKACLGASQQDRRRI